MGSARCMHRRHTRPLHRYSPMSVPHAGFAAVHDDITSRAATLDTLVLGVDAASGYASFALIVIVAFNTFDTGHPFSAASAYFWKVAASAPGTFPTTSRWLAVIVHPESSFSMVSVT